VTPIIVTLGTMYVARGFAFTISGGDAIVAGLPNSFSLPGQSDIGPIPTPVVIAVIVVLLFYLLLHHTLLGKYTYAIGGNRETAILSGIPVARVQIVLYTLSGLAAGLGGVILASRLASGQPTAATGFEFDVIIAIILGGTSLAGGAGKVSGTVLGALFVAVLENGLDLLGVPSFYQYIALGTVLIAAVILDVTLKGEGVTLQQLRNAPWATLILSSRPNRLPEKEM
jgi:ribose transport system permease protein